MYLIPYFIFILNHVSLYLYSSFYLYALVLVCAML